MSDTPIDRQLIEPTPVITAPVDKTTTTTAVMAAPPTPEELKSKFVKYAMRNMVKKGGKSLQHFALSAIGLLTLFVGLAYLTK